MTNLSPAADPMPPFADPDWRPTQLTDVYTIDCITELMAWFEDMQRYEAAATVKAGFGLTRLDDLVLDDEYVQPAARGWPWYLIDHHGRRGADSTSGGGVAIDAGDQRRTGAIAGPRAPAINDERACVLGRGRHVGARSCTNERAVSLAQWASIRHGPTPICERVCCASSP